MATPSPRTGAADRGAHHLFALWRKEFAEDRNIRPARFYRMVNEVPTVLLVGIVIMVVVRPF